MKVSELKEVLNKHDMLTLIVDGEEASNIYSVDQLYSHLEYDEYTVVIVTFDCTGLMISLESDL